jgi:CTP:molybdopterin cytidylyltransferase MocA
VILEETVAIVLASGRSRRMGRDKALLPVDGEPMLARTQRLFLSYGVSRVVVVLGENADAVRARVPMRECDVVINTAVDRGPFSSVLLGVERIAHEDGFMPGVFVHPVDVPLASREVCASLAAAVEAPGTCAAVPQYRGRGGHPVCLTPRGARAVRESGSSMQRLDAVLHSWQDRLRRIRVDDPRVTMNWNSPGDPGRSTT